jgi:hypothetical protein
MCKRHKSYQRTTCRTFKQVYLLHLPVCLSLKGAVPLVHIRGLCNWWQRLTRPPRLVTLLNSWLLQPIYTSTKQCAASTPTQHGQQQEASQRPPSHCAGGALPGPPPPPKKAVTVRSVRRSGSRSACTRTVDASGCCLRHARAGQARQAEQRTSFACCGCTFRHSLGSVCDKAAAWFQNVLSKFYSSVQRIASPPATPSARTGVALHDQLCAYRR